MEPLSFRSLFLVSLCFKLSVYSSFSQPDFELRRCYEDAGSYTNESSFKSNLDTVLSTISSNTNIDYGYYNFSDGDGPDRANAVALCRGDRPIDQCRSCVNDATIKIRESCPNQAEAFGLYDTCLIRYSKNSISSNSDIPMLLNPQTVTDVIGYNQALRSLLERLRDEAASGSSTLKFATGTIEAPSFQTIYGFLQCAPDLSKVECEDCLNRAIRYVPRCCNGSIGARITPAICFLRYENSRFYSESPSPPPPSLLAPQPPPVGEPSNRARTIIIIVVTSVAGLILIVAISVVLIFRKRKRANSMERVESLTLREQDEDEIFTAEMLQFDFAIIKAATDDFSVANKLGQGGFGPVYKGKLSNGENIAVKRLSRNSGQGDLEFKNEVVLVSKLQHRNLVRLLGFSLQGSERLLVYEFVPNASLDQFVFDPQRRTNLDWDRRFKIISGIARGLFYLHEDSRLRIIHHDLKERRFKIIGGIARGLLYLHKDSRLRIIHRNLKASNILLDAQMNAKISDFGMTKLFEVDEMQGNTSRVVGTYGYMSPEYVLHGQFSVKSDVYNFGIIILEIVSGQKNNCFCNGERVEDLLSFVWNSWREGRASNVIDPTLTSGSKNEMMRCIHIGLLCVQEDPAQRPTMASVVLMLTQQFLSLPPRPSRTCILYAQHRRGSIEDRASRFQKQLPLPFNEASITNGDLRRRLLLLNLCAEKNIEQDTIMPGHNIK